MHICRDCPVEGVSLWSRAMDKFSIPTPQDIQDEAKSKGWSIKRLCDAAGISPETFFRWRDGRNTIGVGKLQALLDVLAKPE